MDNGASSYLRFLDGDKEGFVELVEEYRNRLVLFIDSFVGDMHLSEEAADDAFMQLYVKKPRYKSEYSFKAWLYTIGKNAALDYLRRLKKRRYAPIDDYVYLSDKTDIEAEYIQGEENIVLHNTMRKLKKEYAQVLYLIYFEGLSNQEAEKVMGKSSRQISDLIYRAKQALRAELERGERHE
ncbi:MAG: RNA polymerase sigma factor [Ruminococcus sp.]|nr:RNA polymerase sigma factor [Ruminococcus sp.]